LITPASAYSSGYRCTVKDAVMALRGTIWRNDLTKSYIGKEFVVARSNGRMLGGFASGHLMGPQILDSGSRQQSFKVEYTSEPYVHVRLLTGNKFMDGNQKDSTCSMSRPFFRANASA
jgi:hypothetical protein